MSLVFSYTNLWNTLQHIGMSKTELRDRLKMSSATMAKLSANQPVALDVLGKICHELHCSLGDVVTFGEAESTPSMWSTIRPEATYLFSCYFRISDEDCPADFLYGFATPFALTEEGLDSWTLNDDTEVFTSLNGYLTGETLLKLLDQIPHSLPIGEILDLLGIQVRSGKPRRLEAVRAAFFCNGRGIYRPLFWLPAENVYLETAVRNKPLLSFDEREMCCESFFGCGKQSLYSPDGTADYRLAKELWEYLSDKLPLHRNPGEMARLGNLEIFSYPGNCAERNTGIHWKILDHEGENEKGIRRIADAIEVRFDHEHIHGHFMINIILSNTKNPFSNFLQEIYLDADDIVIRHALSESVTTVEIQVWKKAEDSSVYQPFYHTRSALIREFHLAMSLQERRIHLEDEWTRRLEKDKLAAPTDITYNSVMEHSFGNSDNEPWYQEEPLVRKDFQTFLESSSPIANGAFFAAGTDKALEFSRWLSRLLRSSKYHRVILIDPYIEADSIIRLLRSISNTGIAYEVYTDSSARADAQKKKERLDALRRFSMGLEILAPPKLLIRSCSKSDAVLHDRCLILLSDDLTPTVYSLTNSLDGMAKEHASFVTQTNSAMAREIFDYYLQLFHALMDEGKMETFYDSVMKTPAAADGSTLLPTEQAAPQKVQDLSNTEYTSDDFLREFEKSPKESLAMLARMKYEEKEKVYTSLRKVPAKKCRDLYVSILKEGIADEETQPPSKSLSREFGTVQLLYASMDDPEHDLLESTRHLLHYYDYYFYHGTHYERHYAARLLWKLDTGAYLDLLRDCVQRHPNYRELPSSNLFAGIRDLMEPMLFYLSTRDITEEQIALLLKEPLDFVRALGISYVISLPREAGRELSSQQIDTMTEQLQLLENSVDRLRGMIALTSSLQVLMYQKRSLIDHILSLTDIMDGKIADEIALITQKDSRLSTEPKTLYGQLHILYSRNSEDICKIVMRLFEKGVLSDQNATNILTEMCLEKYRQGITQTNVYFQEEDLSESRMIIRYLDQIGNAALKPLKKEMEKIERQMARRLYQAFLYSRNYRLWKCSIDLYCCMICLEQEIASLHPDTYPINQKGTAEFHKLTSNFESTLEKYSEVYRCYKG